MNGKRTGAAKHALAMILILMLASLCACYQLPEGALLSSMPEATPSPTPLPQEIIQIEPGVAVAEAIRDTTFILRGANSAGTQVTFSSGIVLTADGIAATAFHCISLYDAVYTATFSDGSEVRVIDLIAADPRLDIALIQLEGVGFEAASVREEVLPVGSEVYALGNSGGYGITLSEGIHSVLREDAVNAPEFQHTAAISSGNSGGPLFDNKGRLVAINKAKRNGEHLNIATPVGDVLSLMEQAEDSAPDLVWGARFANGGIAFEHSAFREDGYYQGQYKNGDFNGLVGYEHYKGGVAGYPDLYRGDFVDGAPGGFIHRTYKENASDYYEHYEMGEFAGLALNGKGMTEYMYDYVRGDFVDGEPHGFAISLTGDGVYIGQWEEGEWNGRGTLISGDNVRTGNYKNGKWTGANNEWLPAFGEGVVYKRMGSSTYSFTWDPVPGAAYYLLYVRMGDQGDFVPVRDVDEEGAITRFYPQFEAGYSLNLSFIAPNLNIPVKDEAYFYVSVQPIVTEKQFEEMEDTGLSDDTPARKVHTRPLLLKYDSYSLISDDSRDYSYTIGDYLGDLDPPNYLGWLSSTGIYSDYSVFNPYGIYGAKTSLRSIWNPEGAYGSAQSEYSAYNPTAEHPPKIYDSSLSFVGYLTKNSSLPGAIDPDELFEILQAAGV